MATVTKGKTFISGDLVTPAALHQLVDSASVTNIANADIASGAAIADTKLATIATAGKVSNSATTATPLSQNNAIVARDASGNFVANTISANLSGTATNVSGTVAVANGGTGGTTAAAARTGLGLGNSATLNTGTASGTVATGDHTHAQLHERSHAITSTNDHTASNWKVFHSNGAGQVVELSLGAAGQVLTANGTAAAPNWQTLSATTTNADNLTGGSAGTIPYQSAAGDTAMLSAGTSGQVLRSNGATAPSWDNFGTSGNTANAVVARDGFGNFSAGTITANLTGTASGNAPTSHTHDDRYYTETEMNTLLANKQAAGNYAPASSILPTAITGTAVIMTDSRLSDARSPSSHSHGNISNTGAIGSTASLPIITGASGVLQVGSFGTDAGTYCQGNDSRLSDTRTPTDNSVTAVKLANDAVTTAKLANSSVTAENLNGSQSGSAPIFGCRAWVNFNGATTADIGGTYNRTGTTLTVDTTVNHGFLVGHFVYLDFTSYSGIAITDGFFVVASVLTGTRFTVVHGTAGNTTGNVTLPRRTIRGQGNIASVSYIDTGIYSVNFSTAMPSANYALGTFATYPSIAGDVSQAIVSNDANFTPTAVSCQVRSANSISGAEINSPHVHILFIG